jgi:archaemetzincin
MPLWAKRAGGVAMCFFCLVAGGRGSTAAEAAAADKPWSVERLKGAMDKLRPLHKKLEKPLPGEWLYQQEEAGQTFAEYLRSDPVIPQEARRTIHVQPLGEFTEPQRRLVTLTAEFLGIFYNLPVTVEKDLPLSVVPPSARRTHPTWGVKQILSTCVLDDILKPRLPKDAFAYIAFTPSDLWPGEGWNFVFGQASLRERVGVWSLSRFGDPAESDETFRLALLRTLKVGSHEMGHMFSIQHCTAYDCDMCGSNSLPESDRRPLALCPECMAKVCWATRTDPVERYRKLAAFAEKQGLKPEAARYRQFIEALGTK